METGFSKLTRFVLVVGMAASAVGPPAAAQDAPVLEIALYPGIRVTGEVGTTYVIESKAEVEGDFWLTRGWIELTTPTAMWTDPVATDAARRIYRAVKVTKPVVQTIANMVWIAPGRFTMGSPESERGRWEGEGPQTRVTLTKGFWLGKYEVTQREYLALMGNNPSHFQASDYPEDMDRPVERVSWEDAMAYCQKLTGQERAAGRLPPGYEYRLPTEAQWEYACRAGTMTRFSFGDALGCDDWCDSCALLDSYMWWCGSANGARPSRVGLKIPGGPSGPGPGRVGQKLPNPWGLYDMHVNLWEWCGGWWSENLPGGSVIDPTGSDSGSYHVIRGGGWVSWLAWGDAGNCRSAYRSWINPPEFRDYNLGFRVLLAPVQQ